MRRMPNPISAWIDRLFPARERKKRDREREAEAPKPLATTLTRTLTPKVPNSARFSQPTSTLLIRLPIEIRQIIWSYCVGNQHLHIVRCNQRLASHFCMDDLRNDSGSNSKCWGMTSSPRHEKYWNSESTEAPTLQSFPPNPYPRVKDRGKILALLMTCHMVYGETIDLLYSRNLLDTNHLDTVIYLQRTTLPWRFNTIRTFRLEWRLIYAPYNWEEPDDIVWLDAQQPPFDLATWRKACSVMADMQGLRDLEVSIRGMVMWPSVKAWRPFLDPLAEIRQTDKMEVQVQMPLLGCEEAFNDIYHFNVRLWWHLR